MTCSSLIPKIPAILHREGSCLQQIGLGWMAPTVLNGSCGKPGTTSLILWSEGQYAARLFVTGRNNCTLMLCEPWGISWLDALSRPFVSMTWSNERIYSRLSIAFADGYPNERGLHFVGSFFIKRMSVDEFGGSTRGGLSMELPCKRNSYFLEHFLHSYPVTME